MRPIKVLHFYKSSLPESYGGVESFIDTLCRTDAPLGVENTVLALAKNPSDEPIKMNGYTVYQVNQDLFLASTGFSRAAFGKFRALAKETDIIHYHFPNPFADVLHFATAPKKPTVITYHSDIIKQKNLLHLYRPLERNFLSSMDRIVATSPNYLVSSGLLQRYRDKVSIIPIGIDVAAYPQASAERLEYWRAKLPPRFFLFVGAMRYYKGLHFALEAIAGTDIQLAIAGFNGIEKDLKAQAQALNLENVQFLGFVSEEDKAALLELCYAFVFPSHLRSEAFGIALLEAAAFSKPLITAEIGTGTTYVNIANETGLVVPPANPEELRYAMQYLLDHPDVAKEMGEKANARVKELFTAELQARAYYDLYQELLNSANS